jgi:ubiquinone/menaquinone biosynthesis C-methylase UbiE
VPDIDAVLSEIDRVLKPGGAVISFFPSMDTWYEGHCGVPLLHRFPKGDFGLRLAYAYVMRVLGFGYFKEGKGRLEWARGFCEWLDKWTYYRPYRTIAGAFSRFVDMKHFEDDYLDWRLPALSFFPRQPKTFVVRRGGGLAFSCRKPSTS